MRATNTPKAVLAKALGLAVCILPPVFAVLCYFPLWSAIGTEHIFSGITVLLLLICSSPLFRFIKSIFLSPASYTVWGFIFIIFFMLSRIAEQMTVISLVGFISNVIGAIIFKFADRLGKEG